MKTNKSFMYILLIFFVISINSIYSFSVFLSENSYSFVIKQTFFYLVGISLILVILKMRFDNFIKYSFYIYIINIFLLILVLFFGNEINGTKAWFSIPFFGSFQPSEFMKIGLILYLSKIIDNHKLSSFKDEFFLILKVFFVTFIPSFLTFLEPDTGAVIIYFVISSFMLFMSKIRYRWFILIFLFIFLICFFIIYLYVYETDFFITIFGSSMFYRFDRIFDWKNLSGMQLENSIISIGSSGILGNGISNILLYLPEGHTDFIFSSFASIYGLLGIIILLISIILFDLCIFCVSEEKRIYAYISSGIGGAVLYQQIQNISMTIGLLPITGITLPFISYGGSSLVSYMILLGIVMLIKKSSKETF